VLNVDKKAYVDITSTPQSLDALVAEHEAWLSGTGKRSKKRKKK